MSITFEHPTNELIRSLLRIEKLFLDLDQSLRFFQEKNLPLMLVASIIRLLERPDLKLKLTNLLNQQYLHLKSYINNPQIEPKKLSDMLDRVERRLNLLRSNHSLSNLMPGSHLLIKKYQTEIMSHGATALNSDPLLFAWENLDNAAATKLLSEWRLELDQLYSVVGLVLELIRSSQSFKTIKCNSNFYSQSINSDYNLIRLILPVETVPEFSASRHHMALRFKQVKFTSSGVQLLDTDVKEFDISFCF